MKRFVDLQEAKKTATFTFGRFNPPTTGHEKLINALAKQGGDLMVYPSHSQDPKKNPLPHARKIAYMKKMFPKYAKNIIADRARNVFEISTSIYNRGYRDVVMVVGSDRVKEFESLLNKYNDVEGRHGYYKFDSIKVVSAGDRDPDAEGVSGMSASKMRAAAAANDFESFQGGLPKGFKDSKKLFADIKLHMNIKEDYNLTQEDLIRDLYIRGEIWNVGDVVETTNGDEGKIIRKGTNYVVFEDLRKVWLHDLQEVKQDKDIKDKEGTQPAKYFAKDADGDEMSVATKKKRAAHFAKSKSGPAPGDADADTKPSKHTKKFKQMYGEDEDPCWDTHKQVGTKTKNGKQVPNCVPKEETEVDEKTTYMRRDKKLPNLKVKVNRRSDNDTLAKRIRGDKVKKLGIKEEDFQLDEKIEGLVTKAEKSGMPYSILKKVYDRGMAAYKTGHRPGTTAQQWAFARVNSFTTKSKGTWGKADADLAKQVRGEALDYPNETAKEYKKTTPGQMTKESIDDWFMSESTREKYEDRYGNEWLSKLSVTYDAMLEKIDCCDDCNEQYNHIAEESEYQGKKVKLNDPIRTSENPKKKFKVYVKNENGKVVVVRFGDPKMSINRDDPAARKSFRARHGCDKDAGPKWKAKYWSCYQWRAGAKVDN